MKKQLNPVVIAVILVVVVAVIGGWFAYTTNVPTKSTSFLGPDGKRHFPKPAGGSGAATTTKPESGTSSGID